MGLAMPAALLLLLGVLLLAGLSVAALRWQRAALARLAGGSSATLLLGAASPRRRAAKAALALSALALLATAAAGPYAGAGPAPLRPERTDVMVVLDVSLSMLAQDVQPSRFEAARRSIERLLDTLETDRVGLVIFGGRAALRSPLTLDYAAVRNLLRATTIDSAPLPGSSLADALRTAAATLRHSDAPRRGALLISDGEDLDSDVAAAVAELTSAGVPVSTLGAGTPQGGTIPVPNPRGGGTTLKRDQSGQVVTTRLDERTLRDIAAGTGGRYLLGSSGGRELVSLHESLRTPGVGGAAEPDGPANSLTPLLALAALALLVAETLTSERPAPRRAGLVAGLAPLALLLLSPACASADDEAFNFNQAALGAYERGRYDEALTDFRKAQVLRPDLAELDLNAGAGLYKKGEDERALREWQRAAQAEDERLRQRAVFNSGNALYLMERYADAAEAYKRVLREHPEDLDAKINLELALGKLPPPGQQPPGQQPPGQQPPGQQPPGQQPPGQQPPGQQPPGQQPPGQQPPGQQQPGQQPPAGPSDQDLERELRRALAEAGQEFDIEDALRILDALRARERALQQQYNQAPQTPGAQPPQRPARDW